MSTLQQSARPFLAPLIRGEAATLDRDQQELIGSWLVMTMMTAAWSVPAPGARAIPAAHYRRFALQRRPLLQQQVWIAPCSHDDRPAGTEPEGVRYRLMNLEHFEVTTPAGLHLSVQPAYAATVSIGNLAALLVGHTYDVVQGPVVYFDGVLSQALQLIWPVESEVLVWPHGYALNYPEFERLLVTLEPWK